MSTLKITDVWETSLSSNINTDDWIEAALKSDPITKVLSQAFEIFQEDSTNRWVLEDVAEFMENQGYKQLLSDNTSNNENDLSYDIDYGVYLPEGSENHDWFYDSMAIVVLRRHLGGDVRGNYSSPEFFKLSDNEMAFFERQVGWTIFQARNSQGKIKNIDSLREQFEIGYTHRPTYYLSEQTEKILRWNDSEALLKLKTGEIVKVYPSNYHLK
jgi:hypothetical protein